MSALACDLMDIAQAAQGCEEQFAGIGQQIHVAYPEDLEAVPEFEANKAQFTSASFTFKSGKGAWKFRIKKQSGHITSTGNAGAKGYNVQLEFVIDRDIENAAHVLRILKNRGDAIFFAERSEGGYFVIYDPISGTEINSNYDSGTTPESDSGHTVTVTSSPNRYSIAVWNGTIQLKSAAGVGG